MNNVNWLLDESHTVRIGRPAMRDDAGDDVAGQHLGNPNASGGKKQQQDQRARRHWPPRARRDRAIGLERNPAGAVRRQHGDADQAGQQR
jgi:hypothetical protein